MKTPACSKTLVTTELLEIILSNLPLRDLLLAQRVCRTWRTLISTSPTLQTLLYFSVPSTISATSYTINPLLVSAFPRMLPNPNPIDEDATRDFAKIWRTMEHVPDRASYMTSAERAILFSAWNRNPAAWKRKEASWRRMFITMPPAKTLVWRKQYSGMAGTSYYECVTGLGSEVRLDPEEGENESKLGTVVRERPWLKVKNKELPLESRIGLRMRVLYDYLFDAICTGSAPGGFSLEFAVGRYPSLTEVQQRTEDDHDMTLSLKRLVQDSGEPGVVTMMVDLLWSSGCEDEEEDEYPQFRSDGFRKVEFGPLKRMKHSMWD